ncbi:unnamed protein product [Pipistrellus nathusii]|uniref:Uncharacterized protein n=1 Tax=Pipistrellus nathusii TaxID=59473 RepID=A0ABP0AGZ1_PIPNA
MTKRQEGEEDVGGGRDRAPPCTCTAQHTHMRKWAAASPGLLSGGSQTQVSPDPSDVQKARQLSAGNCQSTEIVSISVYSLPTPNTHHLIWGESIRTGPQEGPKAIEKGFFGGDGGNIEIQGAEALTRPLTSQVTPGQYCFLSCTS